MKIQASGYAVVSNGVLQIDTVSPTRRDSIVNWLVTGAGMTIYDDTTDTAIEYYWNDRRGPLIEVVNVTISCEVTPQGT